MKGSLDKRVPPPKPEAGNELFSLFFRDAAVTCHADPPKGRKSQDYLDQADEVFPLDCVQPAAALTKTACCRGRGAKEAIPVEMRMRSRLRIPKRQRGLPSSDLLFAF
jgi:hypothetical protein